VDLTADHVLTKSVYVCDPDGNRLELFCASMEMAAAKHYLQTTQERSRLMAPLHLEPTTAYISLPACGTVRDPSGRGFSLIPLPPGASRCRRRG
jgi:hypothetical protein